MMNLFKKLTILIFVVLFSTNIYAQVPQGFNFQAVARGADGIPLISQELGVQVSVLKGTEDGEAVYTESHITTTNGIGLIQLVIGEGTPAEGSNFGGLDWATDNYFVKLAIDPAGGTEYEELGVSRLLSVPYALLAENVVNGGLGGGDFPLEIDLNTADTDSSLIINIEGDKTAKPLQVFSRGTGYNGAVWGEAVSEETNEGNQRGVLGFANGMGQGTHIGTFGSAVNFDATGNTRMGAYGQAASKAKYNYGVHGFALGEGSGETEVGGESLDFGSFNLGGYFIGNGNLNGNAGVQGIASGSSGSLRNFGVIGTSIIGADGANIGIRGEASGSSTFNIGFDGEVRGATKNLGLKLNVFNGTSNIGMEVNADTAAILNGDVIINGNLTYDGMSGGSASTLYNLNTTAGDTSFIISADGSESISGALKVRSQTEGQNRGVDSRVTSGSGNSDVQIGTYGRASGEGSGTHYGSYGISLNNGGGNNYGSYGYAQGVGKYNFGVQAVAVGSGSGEIVAIGDEVDGNFGSYNIGGGFYPSGNTNGNTGIDVSVEGDQGQRINIGGEFRVSTTASGQNSGVQTIVNGSSSLNRGFWGLVNGDNNNVGMDLTVEGGTSNIGLIVNAATAAELNGNVYVNGDLNYSGALNNTSDRNLKENIKPLESGLKTIMKLNPTIYNFRGNGEYNGLKLSTGLHYGLIAQEVEQVLPSLVKDNVHTYSVPVNSISGPNQSNGDEVIKTMDYKTMNYTELIPVLIKAVQEQQSEIERLTKEVERLKSEKK